MKKTLYSLSLFFCLFGLIGLTCFGNTSYTIQIAASRNPTDIPWFCKKYHIETEIREIKGKTWYQYVVGEFESEREALNYINQHLQSNGLPGPYPIPLPDSLSAKSVRAKETFTQTAVKKMDVVKATASDSTLAKKAIPDNAMALQGKENPTQETQDRFAKYNPWVELIGWKNLRKVEIFVIDGAEPYLPRSVMPFYIKMVDRAIRFPVILFFLMLIILFMINAVIIMIVLELSNTLKNRIERFDQLYGNMYERALTGYIFQEYDLETAVQRIKNIHRTRNRKIFVSVLFNFQKNLSGDLDQKILDIFFRLGLHEDAIKKTKSKSFYLQIIGLSELTNLYPSGAFPIVEGHINDKNNELRAQAQTSYVRLNQVEPFRFLKSLTKPFTQWTQLTSFYIFKLHKLPAPSFVEYLKSDLYNVQNFSLRMIIYFQQKENADEIVKLLNANREQTRFLAIKAINELGIHEAKTQLKEAFTTETYMNRLEIIKALKHIGDTDDFEFLEYIIRQNNVTLKIEACRSMYFMNSLGMEYLLRLNLEKELNIQPYIAHIYDPRN
ncbi:MAG TPA: hypothetical protein DCL77_03310 [Prolixibacteraceae bacterium]|nr:hypothetical protein [Prolixibacteraceae bacterium]